MSKKKFNSVNEYINSLPPQRVEVIQKIRTLLIQNLPKGFEECINYNMIGYVVPKTIFPKGYHCNPKLPLPFINLASQKNYIALYHLGIYADKELLEWFKLRYSHDCQTKLDMGKSCIRFKKEIPYQLIAELAQKMTVEQWISLYTKELKRT